MIVLLSKVLEGPAGALLAAVFRGIVVKVVVILGKFFRVVVCVSYGSCSSLVSIL